MRKLLLRGMLLIVLALAGIFTAVALADHGSPSTGHIGICHHTGNSVAHEWVYITPDASGVFSGHGKLKHQFEEDIIPAFTLVNAHGQTLSFSGLNLTTHYAATLEPNPSGSLVGADILANHCVAPSSTTAGTTTMPTTTPTTTVTPPTTITVTTPTTTTVTVTTPGGTTTITGPKPPTKNKVKLPPKKSKAPFTY